MVLVAGLPSLDQLAVMQQHGDEDVIYAIDIGLLARRYPEIFSDSVRPWDTMPRSFTLSPMLNVGSVLKAVGVVNKGDVIVFRLTRKGKQTRVSLVLAVSEDGNSVFLIRPRYPTSIAADRYVIVAMPFAKFRDSFFDPNRPYTGSRPTIGGVLNAIAEKCGNVIGKPVPLEKALEITGARL